MNKVLNFVTPQSSLIHIYHVQISQHNLNSNVPYRPYTAHTIQTQHCSWTQQFLHTGKTDHICHAQYSKYTVHCSHPQHNPFPMHINMYSQHTVKSFGFILCHSCCQLCTPQNSLHALSLFIYTKWTRYSALLTPQYSIDPHLPCSAAIKFHNIT